HAAAGAIDLDGCRTLRRAAVGLSCPTHLEERAMMIDMHAHWRPAEVADALRARTREPHIVRNENGVEVLKAGRMGEAPLAEAFDDVDFHLGRMRSEEHTSELQSLAYLVCRILLEK